jgi:hypothetical protein
MADMGSIVERSRSARDLLDAGIVRFRNDEKSAALVLFGMAEELYNSAGDSWNAGIARRWLDTSANNKVGQSA